MTSLQVVILALLAFRLTRLVGWDEVTAAPRAALSGIPDAKYHELAKGVEAQRAEGIDVWTDDRFRTPPMSERRYYVAKLLHCPWCVGFWISLGVSLAAYEWWLDVSLLTALALAFAISAVVGLVAKNLDP